jgi:hypothetical protein
MAGGRFQPGHKHSPEVLEKLRVPGNRKANSGSFKPGLRPHNQTDGVMISCAQCGAEKRLAPWQAARGTRFCSKECAYLGRELKGTFKPGHTDLVPAHRRGHSAATRAKISEAQRRSPRRGPASPLWKGGARAERKMAMGRWEYREWRTAVFERDDFTCQHCGKRGGYLEADHIKPWATHPLLRFDVENGRTLCRPCHLLTDTHESKALKKRES